MLGAAHRLGLQWALHIWALVLGSASARIAVLAVHSVTWVFLRQMDAEKMFSVTWQINVPVSNGTEKSGKVKYWSRSFSFKINNFFPMGKGRAESVCLGLRWTAALSWG